jgi:hypothetical protein
MAIGGLLTHYAPQIYAYLESKLASLFGKK